ncbi:hypothetical protein M3J09_010040 [Ascochyta lentis]
MERVPKEVSKEITTSLWYFATGREDFQKRQWRHPCAADYPGGEELEPKAQQAEALPGKQKEDVKETRKLFRSRCGGVWCLGDGAGGRRAKFIPCPHTCCPLSATRAGCDCGFIFTLAMLEPRCNTTGLSHRDLEN